MKVIIICGATGTGKTQIAIELSKKLECEIVNFDSIQAFKELNIGSAKPTSDQLKEAKHHLIDFLNPNEAYTAGDFKRNAEKILNELSLKHKFVILVGGTGFYLNALLSGMSEAVASSTEIKNKLKDELDKRGIDALYEELKAGDPDAAKKIHLNDTYRILRAIEILRYQNKRPSQLGGIGGFKYEYIKIGLRREKPVLRIAIQARSQDMVKNGLIQEVEALVEKYGADIKCLHSVGYKQALDFILSAHKSSHEKLVEKITTATMQLVKKQSTWFNRDHEIHWFDPDKENILEKILGLLIIQRWH
ncbi:MAG: tRNA (adenosine(37)-N6)-dimethylallyltransferase MiaA [Oligoflexia bacterium]|nr:tRNA (adenosine(37)-N6)-dimethylallyltransferase MiaA [Oligoflexia bacterium]